MQYLILSFKIIKAHLGKPLEDYLGKLPRVKLVRSQSRGGLIKARLEGASHARGEVLIFLDSHCEASEGNIYLFKLNINNSSTLFYFK